MGNAEGSCCSYSRNEGKPPLAAQRKPKNKVVQTIAIASEMEDNGAAAATAAEDAQAADNITSSATHDQDIAQPCDVAILEELKLRGVSVHHLEVSACDCKQCRPVLTAARGVVRLH